MQKGSLVFCSSFWSRRGVWLLSMAASTRGCFTVSAGSMGVRNNCVSVRGTQMQQLGHEEKNLQTKEFILEECGEGVGRVRENKRSKGVME